MIIIIDIFEFLNASLNIWVNYSKSEDPFPKFLNILVKTHNWWWKKEFIIFLTFKYLKEKYYQKHFSTTLDKKTHT